ncbi:hypothetical protein [Hyphomonas sp.]|uniref:hypothetical protein n=1 Tax=Hyphomonas sp. TaxID=87 RepID=UPI001BCB0C71|nr:hypothetical protein [Hyphomonas sp.]
MSEIYSRRLLASMYMHQARMLYEDGQRKAARGLLVKAMAMLVLPVAAPSRH